MHTHLLLFETKILKKKQCNQKDPVAACRQQPHLYRKTFNNNYSHTHTHTHTSLHAHLFFLYRHTGMSMHYGKLVRIVARTSKFNIWSCCCWLFWLSIHFTTQIVDLTLTFIFPLFPYSALAFIFEESVAGVFKIYLTKKKKI